MVRAMDYIDRKAISYLRDASRRLLWASADSGGQFENDEFASQFISDGLREAIRLALEQYGNVEDAFEIADTIILGYINLELVPASQPAAKRPQTFGANPVLPTTGAPGRPSNMHLIEAEFDRRCNLKQTKTVLAREAESLAEWFNREYPRCAVPSVKTIGNRLRAKFNGQRPKL